MLLSIHFRGQRWLRQQTKMFHFISFIGRWSMLDIFVIALLSALVQFGFFTTIQAAPAATWFTAVVVLSMFAALSFDPRRLWDACDPQNIRSDRTTDLPAPLS
jgi:paraquat-inducible protein A